MSTALGSPFLPRSLAADLVDRVAHGGRSLGELLGQRLQALPAPRQRALAQELAFGTLRWYFTLDAVLAKLVRQPLKPRDSDVRALLLVGLYQLLILGTSPHAAVHETVEAVRHCGKRWAIGLANAVLRNAQRRSGTLLESVRSVPSARWSYPPWWIEQLEHDWPEHWQQILEAGNQRPPMVLRVNRLQTGRENYLDQLRHVAIEARALEVNATAVRLTEAVSVERLPGFAEGLVTVQDAAAQLAAPLLAPRPGQRILDACAAPGGKTGHILELAPDLQTLVAVDRDPRRLERIRDNLARLRLQAQLVLADAGNPGKWWDGKPFDRILLDAPCSASGVVRRHPDVKLLRRSDDLDALGVRQRMLLEALWPLLAPDGILLYATCSVFRKENVGAVQSFLARCGDARESPLPAAWGVAQPVGRQILPGEQDMDGFYFARLTKATTTGP